ncbi:type VI secretion protein [Pseudomonas gingeri]|uniref:Type VI secretion protein n=1 Tax=Pseudomonas gingeri TaxID=117681 RepID=A0A7Y7XC59_9PSED|nr:type VI secretion protein [Pseudomonas gingeri]NWB97087.1 type VI secretion protein [Pseudomonas gingeri]
MSVRHWLSSVCLLTAIAVLWGCNGNYRFDDEAYRPLGDATAVDRRS